MSRTLLRSNIAAVLAKGIPPRVFLTPLIALLLAGLCVAQTPTVTLTFEGLQDQEPIQNFYSGGFGGFGSGPGPNYGIVFGSDALAIVSGSAGGTGDFSGSPSGQTVAFFLTGTGVVMNVPAGFTTGFAFYYAAAVTPGTVTVYDGLNGTGNILATLSLAITGSNCNGSAARYSCWTPIGVSFTGTAKSVNFGGSANYIGFDNVTLGSRTATNGLIISTSSLPTGTSNSAYPSTALQAQGGTTPYSWTASGLPPGLSLSSTGVLSGTPTTSGTFSVVVTVKDASTPQLNATHTYSLTIASALTVTTSSLPNGAVNTAYPSTTLQAQGGTTPYSWTPSNLPPGLSLSSAGVLSGTPTTSGTFSVVVTVKDASTPQLTATHTFSLTIAAALTVTTSSLPSGAVNTAYPSTALQAQGGTTPFSWTASGLPAGISLSSAGVLSGTPTASGTFSVVVTVKDASTPQLTASNSLPLTIAPATQVQGVTITQNSNTSAPNQTTLSVAFGQPAQSNFTGTLTLSFKPDASVTNVPSTYVDPAAGFPVSAQSSTTLVLNFTIAQGLTQAPVQFGQGTVAGTWTITLTALDGGGASVLPSPAPTQTVVVAATAPVINPGSVKMLNITASGFSVQVRGYATTRDVSSATFVFAPASGAQLQGATVTVPFNGQDQIQWFNTNTGRSAGGTFSLQLPFTYSGDPNALSSVAVTLANARSQVSAQVTGGR